MNEFRYFVSSQWTGGRSGELTTDASEDRILYSAPPEFKGENGKWTPEHLLLSAVSACFVTTFRAIADASKFQFDGLTVEAEGVLHEWPDGHRFASITLRPNLLLQVAGEEQRAQKLLEKTERSCLVSKSLSCLVHLEAKIKQPAKELVAAE
ncbi:MAG: OsmC family protein [Acidobacteriales bacterium]|nr:OsmC family protein [Terriglobales bacterium]